MLQALIDSELLTRWQIDQLLKGRYKGFTLGKYRLLRLLGAGGMSSVYLAEHATLRSKAAVKVLPVKRVEQTSYLARFEREARQSARLNHANIVRTFDLDMAGGIHFIAMEYVDGIDLHAKVKRDGPLPVREAADYIRQAAIGLHHAHEEGLVHRDIKPANLMLDTRGTVKILDLGLALANNDEDGSLTREHDEKVLGTADYLAPEQATDSHTADRRSDIYSLGCTLYYLLVGKPPFASGKLAERLQAHLKKPPPNLLDQRPDVPVAIADLYFRMLQKHPDGRPQTAQEVADSLSAWLLKTSPGPVVRTEAPRRTLPRRSASGGVEPAVAVVKSGPGSGGSGGPAPTQTPPMGVRPGGGRATSPSSSGVRREPLPRSTPKAAEEDDFAAFLRMDTSSSTEPTSSGGAANAESPPKPKKPLEFAGLPLAYWIIGGGCLLVAVVLGVFVLMKNTAPPSRAGKTIIEQSPLDRLNQPATGRKRVR
jgi:serine/threonine protein kinase